MSSNTINYHGALKPLAEACRIAQVDILLIEDLLQAPQVKGLPANALLNVLLRKAAVAGNHLLFVFRVLRLKKDQHLLIQEFSNIPLALIFPFISFWRGKLFFVVNHNLQWAGCRFTEKVAFRLLGWMGGRFIFFEQIPESALRELGVNLKTCFSLPHPVPNSGQIRTRSGGIKRIGVIGQFRAEKGIDGLLQHLESLLPIYDVVVGVPNILEFKKHSKFGSANWFELHDTGRLDVYQKVLSGCDVMVLNYPDSGYEFRASGLIADAAAAHVPVVVRKLPVLESQISNPVCIGESFDELGDLKDALGRAGEKLSCGAYPFDEYIQSRSAGALAKFLNGVIGSPNG